MHDLLIFKDALNTTQESMLTKGQETFLSGLINAKDTEYYFIGAQRDRTDTIIIHNIYSGTVRDTRS